MAALSRFSEDVSEEELNALIQKAIPEKTKIAKKYGLKGKYKKNLKYQLDSFMHSTNSRWCFISIDCLNKYNNCLTKKKYFVLLFILQRFLLKQLKYSLSIFLRSSPESS